MPSSGGCSVATAKSASSRKSVGRYRTVAHASKVDEALFGQPHNKEFLDTLRKERMNRELSEFPIVQDALAKKKQRQKDADREIYQVVTKDLVRKLKVPREAPPGHNIMIDSWDLHRIKQNARVMTKEELEENAKRLKEINEMMEDQAQERKKTLKDLDLVRNHNTTLNDLEEEAKKNAEALLQMAERQRVEQEDEIKHLNELILEAKCHAIRDMQVVERQQINNELVSEERRLDQMMEAERLNSIRVQEEIEERRKIERLEGAAVIVNQIKENEEQRIIDMEKKDQEKEAVRNHLQKLQLEDMITLEKKKKDQETLKSELDQANQEIMRQNELKKEHDKLLDFKVQEYQREKAERELKLEEFLEQQKKEKELELKKMRDKQQKASDDAAASDALRAKRNQEEQERKWRQKELDDAVKHEKETSELMSARRDQIEQKMRFLAIQAQQERNEFDRVLKAQREAIEKDRGEASRVRVKNEQHIAHVKKQIREKQAGRIQERTAFFEEGIKLDQEARARRQKLEDVKKEKIDELHTAGLPDIYCNLVTQAMDKYLASGVK